MNIFNLSSSEQDAVVLLQEKYILPVNRIFLNGREMKSYFGTRIFWKCNIRSCKKKVNMRVGNWLANSRLPFVIVV